MARRRFSASSAAQLMSCVGSADLANSIPGWVDPVVVEGAGAKGKGHELHKIFAAISEYSASDMRKISEALAYVAKIRSSRRFTALIEMTLNAEWLMSKPQTTVDLCLYVADEMHIIDWKTGLIPVDPANNHQLLFYAATFLPLAPKAQGVTVHVVQPWADGSSSWFADRSTISQFMLDALDAEQKILAGDPTRTPSDHCKFCPANPHSRSDKGNPLCPEMMSMLYPPYLDEDEILAL